MVISTVALITALSALIASAVYRKKLKTQHDTLMIDYRPVGALKTEVFALSKTYSDLQEKYKQRRSTLQTFEGIIGTYNVGVGTIDVSTYKPLLDTREVSVLEAQLEMVKAKAKEIVSAKRACISRLPSNIAINGRKSAAKTFVNREIRLRIRCL